MAGRMKQFLIMLLVVLSATPAFAQKKKKKSSGSSKPGTVNYTVESNDPSNAPNLSFSLNPFIADIYTLNINLGYSAELNYRLNNRWEFGGFYRGSYLDRFKTTTGNPSVAHGFSDDEEKGVQSFGFNAMFYFKDDLRVINEDIEVKQHSDGSTRVHYVIQVPARRLTLYGFRLGYESFNSSVYSENSNIKFTGAPVNPQIGIYYPTDLDGRYSAYLNSGYMSIGFCRTRITDIHVDTDKYGKKRTAAVTQLYADLLYSTSASYSGMNVAMRDSASQQYNSYAPYTVTSPFSKIGMRVGFTQHANYRFQPLGVFGVELGLRPGPKAGMDNLYLMIKFGLNLSMKAGSSSADADLEDSE